MLSDKVIDRSQIETLQRNLIRSHSVGVGPIFEEVTTRAIVVLRANVIAKGFSGVRLEVLRRLMDMINKGVHPLIPEQGSGGASGDLAPLAHLTSVMMGEGEAIFRGMMVQVSAASLASENKVLAHPASVDSIPTSADKEDHVSMGTIAARKARDIVRNVELILAMELLCATQGLEFLLPLTPGRGIHEAYLVVREKVPPIKGDRRFSVDIEKIHSLIESRELVRRVESVAGPLQ